MKTWKDLKFRSTQGLLSFTAILDDRGRIVVPASIRRRMRVKFGSLIVAKIEPVKAQHVLEEVDLDGK